MSSKSQWSHHEEASPEGTAITSSQWDDAEKGLYDNTPTLPVLPPPAAHLDEKKEQIIESYSTANVTVPPPAPRPAAAKKSGPKPNRWILLQLWFNTYRKFFTFVTLLNLTGIVLAACDRFPYAENHLGALVLGNLLMAVLMRNELFLRFLYIISIYGLRSVRPPLAPFPNSTYAHQGCLLAVGTALHQVQRDVDPAACRRHPLGVCAVGCCVSQQAFIFLGWATLTALLSWLVYKVVDIIRYRAVQHPSVLATGILTNVAVIISVLSAFPWIRKSVPPPCLSRRLEENHQANKSTATTTTRSRDTTALSDGWASRYVTPPFRVRVGC